MFWIIVTVVILFLIFMPEMAVVRFTGRKR